MKLWGIVITIEKRKTYIALIVIACALPGCLLWLSLRQVEIIAVHKDDNHNYVLVKKFPITKRERIKWWLENKNSLKNNYEMPSTKPDGSFVLIFWDFGEGYKKTDGYDRLCFSDMNPPENCIDKNALLMVRDSKIPDFIFSQ